MTPALLGQLSAFTFGEVQTVCATTQRHPSEGRQHAYSCFQHHGYRMCRKEDLHLPPLNLCSACGPQFQYASDAKPYEYYTHFLGDDFLAMMITGTNTYAEHKITELHQTGKLTRVSRWHRWKPVTMEEMRAIIINIGIMSIPDLEAYWKTSWECYMPFFHDVMGRNRFKEIYWNLHIPQPSHSTRRVDKVGLLLDHIRTKSQSAFHPGKEVAVDETMVGFRGRISFKQYCPKKPTKYGLKFFVLPDSNTGYVYNFLLYTGSEVTSTLPLSPSQSGPVCHSTHARLAGQRSYILHQCTYGRPTSLSWHRNCRHNGPQQEGSSS